MKQGVKRPIQAYVIHTLWILMTFCWSMIGTLDSGKWIFRLSAFVGFVFLVEMIARRYYFEIRDGKLIINDSFLRTRTIDLDKIEKFDIESGLFSSSKIILKDRKQVKYMDSQTDDKKLKELMEKFQITVE